MFFSKKNVFILFYYFLDISCESVLLSKLVINACLFLPIGLLIGQNTISHGISSPGSVAYYG